MHAMRPSLRPSKGYSTRPRSPFPSPRVPNGHGANGKGAGTRLAPQSAGKGPTRPVSAPAEEPVESGTSIDAFSTHLAQGGREFLEEFAFAVVDKLSRKDLVFFILRMKKSLEARGEKDGSPHTASANCSLDPKGVKPKKKSATKRADSVAECDTPKRRKVDTASLPEPIARKPEVTPTTQREFLPVLALKARVDELVRIRQEEFLPAEKRTREEEEQFTQLLGRVESSLFFNDENELLVDELHERVSEINPLCRKVKDYLSIWQNVHVPQTAQAAVAAELLKLSPTGIDGATMLATLAKNMKLKLNQAEVLFQDISLLNSAPTFLAKIYPTPKTSFGWSRIGWSFTNWLQFVTKILANVSDDEQLVYLNAILQILKELGQEWDEEKKEAVWEYAAKLSGRTASELMALEALTF